MSSTSLRNSPIPQPISLVAPTFMNPLVKISEDFMINRSCIKSVLRFGENKIQINDFNGTTYTLFEKDAQVAWKDLNGIDQSYAQAPIAEKRSNTK